MHVLTHQISIRSAIARGCQVLGDKSKADSPPLLKTLFAARLRLVGTDSLGRSVKYHVGRWRYSPLHVLGLALQEEGSASYGVCCFPISPGQMEQKMAPETSYENVLKDEERRDRLRIRQQRISAPLYYTPNSYELHAQEP